MSNTFVSLGLVALGGAGGSVLRVLVGMALPGRFPWATLIVNVVGSFLIGWLMARLGPVEPHAASSLRSALVAGFCGGFTTFSTFSWQTLEQMQRGAWSVALLNIFVSVVFCLAAVWLGYRVGSV